MVRNCINFHPPHTPTYLHLSFDLELSRHERTLAVQFARHEINKVGLLHDNSATKKRLAIKSNNAHEHSPFGLSISASLDRSVAVFQVDSPFFVVNLHSFHGVSNKSARNRTRFVQAAACHLEQIGSLTSSM